MKWPIYLLAMTLGLANASSMQLELLEDYRNDHVELNSELDIQDLLNGVSTNGLTVRDPSDPDNPYGPFDPYAPFGPLDPMNPLGPKIPVFPIYPINPIGPIDPYDPHGPIDPYNPFDPFGPLGPRPAFPTFPKPSIVDYPEICLPSDITLSVNCFGDACPSKNSVYPPCRGQSGRIYFKKDHDFVYNNNLTQIKLRVLSSKGISNITKNLNATPNVFKLAHNIGNKVVKTNLSDFKRYIDLECKDRTFNYELLTKEQEKTLKLVEKFCSFSEKIDHFEDYEELMSKLSEKIDRSISLLDIRALNTFFSARDSSDEELRKQEVVQLLTVRWLYMNLVMQSSMNDVIPVLDMWSKGPGLTYGLTSIPMMNSHFNSDSYMSKVLNFSSSLHCREKDKACSLYKSLFFIKLREVVEQKLNFFVGKNLQRLAKLSMVDVRLAIDNDTCFREGCYVDTELSAQLREIQKLDGKYKRLTGIESDEIYDFILNDENFMDLETISSTIDSLPTIASESKIRDLAMSSLLEITEAEKLLIPLDEKFYGNIVAQSFPEASFNIASTCVSITLKEGKFLAEGFMNYCTERASKMFINHAWLKTTKDLPSVTKFIDGFGKDLEQKIRNVYKGVIKWEK